ncbi:UDP-3-O-(3-hydroxymyristoyl)glucosamine N-acyltransferase [Lichenibacterium ramalinae]|uniref:UDP-3-O-acylglucosamine N-acyltransferase n=1 Tax=Lichenibacterium ramalinae TaxID=2316527 RepID=A0A4Q2RES9_9HYPH|nr:UDP-3-O-(3-hydroxymyristoyl)glucosamine N-acyltransferase [Lichenibacterium ramalinae]RYB05703.1 UDP-3-O-(3-hydroxymyristoyl)glucosamine N-acyltransferase [Lichenibacterium ramalinae]
MSSPVFFRPALEPSLADVVGWTGVIAPEGADLALRFGRVAPLDLAGPGDLTFLDNPRYAPALAGTRAAACIVPARYAGAVPPGTVGLVAKEPYRAVAIVAARLYPDAMRPGSLFGTVGVSPSSTVHPEARLEPGVTVDPGAVIGPRAEIGAGTVVGPHAVIGPDVRIGRNCSVGANATVVHALVGDRVILHSGVRIGQDGFGFAMGPGGHLKVPQIGRVVLQDDVEVGANTAIDRGSNRDTVVGEGTKIDNLVQIGHNVSIGRHCVIVSQTGISGSTVLGDYVVTAGQAGLAGHLTIGTGAQIGAKSGVMNDIPAGERWFGIPAQSAREQFRLHATLKRLAKRVPSAAD